MPPEENEAIVRRIYEELWNERKLIEVAGEPNPASPRVIEKLGMGSVEGILPAAPRVPTSRRAGKVPTAAATEASSSPEEVRSEMADFRHTQLRARAIVSKR